MRFHFSEGFRFFILILSQSSRKIILTGFSKTSVIDGSAIIDDANGAQVPPKPFMFALKEFLSFFCSSVSFNSVATSNSSSLRIPNTNDKNGSKHFKKRLPSRNVRLSFQNPRSMICDQLRCPIRRFAKTSRFFLNSSISSKAITEQSLLSRN